MVDTLDMAERPADAPPLENPQPLVVCSRCGELHAAKAIGTIPAERGRRLTLYDESTPVPHFVLDGGPCVESEP